VQSRFNEEHCQALSESCINELLALGVSHTDIQLVTVPGALEIPFALSQLVKTDEFDAFIALGAVIRGETYHFELVSNESASGITRISLDAGVPIANGILTCDTDEQATARTGEKGRDCARAAVEMANLALALTPDIEIESE
jgi:6,7-dimethyl-8-ribityllumazine synthase